jgi:hypothetical protein
LAATNEPLNSRFVERPVATVPVVALAESAVLPVAGVSAPLDKYAVVPVIVFPMGVNIVPAAVVPVTSNTVSAAVFAAFVVLAPALSDEPVAIAPAVASVAVPAILSVITDWPVVIEPVVAPVITDEPVVKAPVVALVEGAEVVIVTVVVPVASGVGELVTVSPEWVDVAELVA